MGGYYRKITNKMGDRKMKRFIKPLTAVMALFASAVIFASCESDSTEVFEPGEYVGQYDESMTPENSCVIYFYLEFNYEATFRQINPDLDVDEQHFEADSFISWGWVVFKPCKPGSRYMLTKLRGVGSNYRWDMDFKPNQQVMVIDVPKEPGVYCYGYIDAQNVALCASEGKAYSLCKPDDLDAKSPYIIGGTMKDAIKNVNSEFKKLYGQTPWYDAYLEKRKVLLSTPKANK